MPSGESPRISGPFAVAGLRGTDLDQVTAWLNEPTYGEPLDIRPPVRGEDIAHNRLPVYDAFGHARIGLVQIVSVLDATPALVGFGVTYGWDSADDLIREMDFALPRLKGLGSLAVVEIMARLAHYCFRHEDALEVRSRNRGGFDRLFARLGARPAAVIEQVHPTRRTRERKQLYHLLPDWFYASAAARRHHLCC